MRKPINKIALIRILMTITGFSLLSIGAGIIYIPAGLIVGGLLLTIEAMR